MEQNNSKMGPQQTQRSTAINGEEWPSSSGTEWTAYPYGKKQQVWPSGTSLEVQRLGLCAPNAGRLGLVSGQELDPICCNWDCMPQLQIQSAINQDLVQQNKYCFKRSSSTTSISHYVTQKSIPEGLYFWK